jgi:DNA-directed RNA polymerase subunit RPC12/RpoP
MSFFDDMATKVRKIKEHRDASELNRQTRDPRKRIGTIDPGEAYARPIKPNRLPRADGHPNCSNCGHNAFKTVHKGELIACRYCKQQYIIKKVTQEE